MLWNDIKLSINAAFLTLNTTTFFWSIIFLIKIVNSYYIIMTNCYNDHNNPICMNSFDININ